MNCIRREMYLERRRAGKLSKARWRVRRGEENNKGKVEDKAGEVEGYEVEVGSQGERGGRQGR